jgi:iron complex outermembrane receptor protein
MLRGLERSARVRQRPDRQQRRGGAARAVALCVLLAAALGLPVARAERAQENAVTAAEDAFGLAVGNQTIGLYSMVDARGFSPQQAGNLRIEGLYFDDPSNYVGPCTVRAVVMRIGITAQSYSFPSPTGIADLRLHLPGDQTSLSAAVSRGPYQESSALLLGQTPLTAKLGASVCANYNGDFAPDQARQSQNFGLGGTLRWRPTERTEVVPFWSYMNGGQHALVPSVYTDSTLSPPPFDVRRLATQPYTSFGWRTAVLGLVVRQEFGAGWVATGGLFRASEQDRRSYLEEFILVPPAPDRGVAHYLDLLPPLSSVSTSGELRLERRSGSERHHRKLEFAVRGRSADRAYGGDNLLPCADTSLDATAIGCGPPPDLGIGASIDRTRQLDIGMEFEERWHGVGSIGVGLLKSEYRRTLHSDVATGSQRGSLKVAPWLGNLRFTAEAGRAVTLYGSFVQGLEDSALAPTTASNRGEPPPATRTHQVDGGVRYAPLERLSLVLGVFEIDKVYFNLDASDRYTALGSVRHRGAEASLAYAANGLTVLGGGVWLKPRVARTAAEPGATGSVPLGPVPLTLSATLDYAPARWQPLAASLQVSRLSARVASLGNDYTLPPLTTVSAGLRYESKLGTHPFGVRFDAMNLTDARGLHVSSVGQVLPEFGRRFMVSFTIDR